MPRSSESIVREILRWFDKNARDLPWRRANEPYAIWISEIMLQQTQVKTVIPYWERWMRELPTVQSLAAGEEERVLKLWEGLGYYTRARNLQKAARIICEKHDGIFPSSFEDILALPGVGRYTAGAICSIAFGQPTPILDGNVIRVLARVFAVEGDSKSKETQVRSWEISSELVFAASKTNACSSLNQGLMELGATICLPREPLCRKCPVRTRCAAFKTHRTAEFPQLSQRPKSRERQFVAFVLIHGPRVLVRKRQAGIVNGGLWEFPNFEIKNGRRAVMKQWKDLNPRPFATIKHTITNNRITLRALRAEANGNAASLAREMSAQWRALQELDKLPFSSAHAKLRSLLRNAPEANRGINAENTHLKNTKNGQKN